MPFFFTDYLIGFVTFSCKHNNIACFCFAKSKADSLRPVNDNLLINFMSF